MTLAQSLPRSARTGAHRRLRRLPLRSALRLPAAGGLVVAASAHLPVAPGPPAGTSGTGWATGALTTVCPAVCLVACLVVAVALTVRDTLPVWITAAAVPAAAVVVDLAVRTDPGGSGAGPAMASLALLGLGVVGVTAEALVAGLAVAAVRASGTGLRFMLTRTAQAVVAAGVATSVLAVLSG